jgi:hypothetical protein
MSNSATSMYDLNLNQAAQLVKVYGKFRTVMLQGHMGEGKSSILKTLASEMPTHAPYYFDCTTKDLGDITIPKLQQLTTSGDEGEGGDCVRYVPNEELGLHLDKPIILMIDEFGKANRAVQNAMLCLMQERKMGARKLHPESVIFANTNLGGEGVGDILLPHARNRQTIVRIRKSTNMEWIENWAINNGIDAVLMAWVKDNPQICQPFEEVKNPDDNQYIFHPKAARTAFVTKRSLHAASDLLKQREHLDDTTLTAALMGTIGERAAMDLMAFVKVSDQLPSLESIKKTPNEAKVPESAAALCMVVYRTLACIERDWVDAWVTYMKRIDAEAQGLFANGVRHPKYARQAIVMQNKMFTEWALENGSMFAADKK